MACRRRSPSEWIFRSDPAGQQSKKGKGTGRSGAAEVQKWLSPEVFLVHLRMSSADSLANPNLGLTLDANLTVQPVCSFDLIILLIRMAQVLAVVDGEACWGELRVGDTITHVNSESVVGKSPDTLQLFESSCKSLEKVVLIVDRPCKGMLHLEHMLFAIAQNMPFLSYGKNAVSFWSP